MRGEGIVPVMDVGNNSGGAFGGYGNGDWAWIIILFLIFGNGRGFGNGFGGGGVGENYILATDFATIERKLDSVNSGICDATFALNNTIVNGNFGLQNALTQGFSGINTALLQGNYGLSSQLAGCCCGIKTQLADGFCSIGRGLDGINYNMAMNSNALQQTLCNTTRDIIENQNANYRALHDELVANRIEDKNAQIQAQQNEINALRLRASQEAQNNYLTATMNANVAEIIRRTGNDCPVPAYVVNGPTPVNFPTNCCGQVQFSNNCGCGNY